MLIEFPCPICQTPLALKKKAVGGQVNCPKCQKLILLPSESPLPRHDPDKGPFQKDQTYGVKEVTQAICTTVEPYRRELETKSDLLNDAVEMVKIRNERIKELETLVLKTQSELWALEVTIDEMEEQAGDTEELDSLRTRQEDLQKEKEELDSKLSNMVIHCDHLNQALQAHQQIVHPDGELRSELDTVQQTVGEHLNTLEQGSAVMEESREWIKTLTDRLTECVAQLQDKERARKEMEGLFQASGEDMQRAVDERNQWRKRAQDLEKSSEEARQALEKLQSRLTEAEKLQEDWSQDRELSKNLRVEMEENLQLLRDRIEQERETHRKLLQEKKEEWKAGADKKLLAVTQKLEKAKEEIAASESKRMDALNTQRILTEQNMNAEEELSKLKKQLENALDRVEELEDESSQS